MNFAPVLIGIMAGIGIGWSLAEGFKLMFPALRFRRSSPPQEPVLPLPGDPYPPEFYWVNLNQRSADQLGQIAQGLFTGETGDLRGVQGSPLQNMAMGNFNLAELGGLSQAFLSSEDLARARSVTQGPKPETSEVILNQRQLRED